MDSRASPPARTPATAARKAPVAPVYQHITAVVQERNPSRRCPVASRVWASGKWHRSQAARRRRTPTQESARTGEGAGGGASILSGRHEWPLLWERRGQREEKGGSGPPAMARRLDRVARWREGQRRRRPFPSGEPHRPPPLGSEKEEGETKQRRGRGKTGSLQGRRPCTGGRTWRRAGERAAARCRRPLWTVERE